MGHIVDFVQNIPKAELHLHIEGSLEPELMFEIGRRNGVTSRFDSVDELKMAYNFKNLQEFLDIYYEGANVLIEERDFYDMTMAYLKKIKSQNVIYAEIFFDPQTHTERGVSFETVVNGISRALADGASDLGIQSKLIMCFVRHLDEDSAYKTLAMAMPHANKIFGVGLDSSEVGNPPSKFEGVFARAAEAGFKLMAHAGEEGPPSYIWEALDLLKVDRIDHGNRCLEDERLVDELIRRNLALTLCPLSNVKLRVVKEMKNHPLREMMHKGLLVTVNSDDPAYFGGYVNENYLALVENLNLNESEVTALVRNSFKAAFLSEAECNAMLQKVDAFLTTH